MRICMGRIHNSRVHIEPGPLIGAATLLAGALALYALAVRTRPGQIVDQALMVRASYSSARVFASDFAALTSPYLMAGGPLLALLVVFGGRPMTLGARVVFMTLGPIATSWVLKRTLDRPPMVEQSTHNSFPSGTLTAVAAIACAIVVVVPRRWRPVAITCGALMTLGTAVMVVALRWHRPSDALAALLIVGAFALLGAALTTDRRQDGHAQLADPRGERLVESSAAHLRAGIASGPAVAWPPTGSLDRRKAEARGARSSDRG